MTLQQCLTCTRRNIPPESASCPACGSVDLRGYDPVANAAPEMVRVLRGIVETCERYDVGNGLTELARVQIHQEARAVLILAGEEDV